MVTTEMVQVYINQLCTEMGCKAEDIYNPQTKSWYITKGSASVEIFTTSYETAAKTVRTFIRCFAPIYALPQDNQKKLDLFQGALEANTQYMGVKIATIASKGFMYAVAERDIDGMDYSEFVTVVSDLAYWADQLDDFLKDKFGAVQTSLN